MSTSHRLGRPTILVGTTLAVLAVGVGTAAAYWTRAGAGTGSAATTTLSAPTGVSVAAVDQTTDSMRIAWTNATGTPAPTSYQVKDGDRTLSCTSTPCTDSGQPAGSSHSYTVTSLYKNAWTASASAVGGSTNTKPTLAITSPTAGQTGVSKTATVQGTTTGGTSPGATISVTVKKTSDNSTVQSPTPTPSDGNWSFALSGLADNTQYTISASQTSAGGTASATAVSFTTAVATTPPTVTVTKPTEGANLTNQGDINGLGCTSNNLFCGSATAGTDSSGAASSLGTGAVTLTLKRTTSSNVVTYWSGSAWGASSTALTATGTTAWRYDFSYANLRSGVSGSVTYVATVDVKNAANISGTTVTRSFTTS